MRVKMLTRCGCSKIVDMPGYEPHCSPNERLWLPLKPDLLRVIDMDTLKVEPVRKREFQLVSYENDGWDRIYVYEEILED